MCGPKPYPPGCWWRASRGLPLRSRGTLALPGYGEKVRRQSGVQGTGSGHQAREEGRTAAAALISSPGISANVMTRNPVNGRPGGAVRRVSQCQSAGRGQTMPPAANGVNDFFSANDFNGLSRRDFGKSGEIDRKLTGDLPVISKACR